MGSGRCSQIRVLAASWRQTEGSQPGAASQAGLLRPSKSLWEPAPSVAAHLCRAGAQRSHSSVWQAWLSQACCPASDVKFKSCGWPHTVAFQEPRNEAIHKTPVCVRSRWNGLVHEGHGRLSGVPSESRNNEPTWIACSRPRGGEGPGWTPGPPPCAMTRWPWM